MTSIVDFEIEQGSTFTRTMSVESNKTPVNLTGYTLAGQLRKGYSASESINFDIEVINALIGKIKISLTSSTTSALIYNKYVYDIEIADPTGVVSRILEGSMTLSLNVTR